MQAPRIWGTLDPFVEGGDVMGRKVANAGFLDALLAADPFDAYHFFPASPGERDRLRDRLTRRHPALAGQGKFKFLTRLDLPRCLADTAYAVFHLSDCILFPAWLAALRNQVSGEIFPITATTHSLSYASFGRGFLSQLWPGTTARDAIVATSTAGQAVVEGIFAGLRRGYGLEAELFPAPRLARIPLGIEPAAYARLEGEDGRAARARLNLPAEAVILLVFGRIAHSSKMDLLPLLRAMQRLIADGLDPAGLCLVLAGWTDDDPRQHPDPVIELLSGLAANIGLPLHAFPRPAEADKQALFGLADLFVSLADNPQETFGLTLLEAMAASLPVVASDYDGYRDIVVDGRTGLLVPTVGLADTGPWDVLAPLCYDNHAQLLLAQGLAVDVGATAKALARLIRDPGLRRAMGRAGRARVEAEFSWASVIARHLDLWAQLAETPVGDREALRRARHPAAMAYGELFAGYATHRLSDALSLTWSPTGQAVYHRRDFPVIYEALGGLIRPEVLHALLFLARSPCPALTLAGRLAAATGLDPFLAQFHVAWALKQDLLEIGGEA